mmetsp:Transcript_4292/g.6647  ORF Transcript_4292/g.6647 Transcript_4292/m.6647 type:complete len:2938 (+) Transcript_4292:149-8962(+)|eukprot:CAMPEP_0194264008 /NCGR_PEP_ID=MMETSP0158-20130606/47364_1 /TAXON_ID=33649 /ORGANISM="Thalassionema nitzschioides, Strain L26-B" /LENGTH=2937 /DNA_ID=CAMNT_0039004235 /DNA_START=94 /DNA_END=8907 /DNA_ORIENTATION=+
MSKITEDTNDENEPESLSLSEYTFRQLSTILEDPEAVKRLQPFLRQQDAVCCLNGESSYGELPLGLDWSIFRKAYTLLIWIKPVLSSPEENTKSPKRKKPWHQAPSSSNIMIVNEKDRRLWYRWSSHASEDKDSRAGICVQSGPWKVTENNQLESTLTAFALPSSFHSMVQIPIRLPANEFSLVGFTHNFPYLKKPQWTVTVNGVLQGRGELKYPAVDTTVNPYLASVIVLQNLGAGGVAQEQAASTADQAKPASELTKSSSENADQKLSLDFHVASMAFHADVIGPELQALMATTGGPSLSLQHGGKVATPLPPVENWTKGSSLEHGPNVGIPLAVHPLSLQVQHLQDKAIHYFGAASSSPKGNKRIVWTQTPLPGSFSSTPKVGLIQPAIPESMDHQNSDGNRPTLQFKGQVLLCHALSEYLMNSSSTEDSGCEIDFNPENFSQQLSIVLQEQGLLTFLILPFFLAQLPTAGHAVELQQSLQEQSLKMLYSLYTNDGAWAASLIEALADCIEHGGSRVHEQVLQSGLLHMLSSALRQSLLRAQQKSIRSKKSLEECAGIEEEESWWRPTHGASCPSWIPMPIAKACARLVLVSCGGKHNADEEDNSLLTHWLRGSDLALTAIFGLALNLDLWGKQEEALLCMLSIVSSRYGTIAGGQLLRRQIPIQSFLDLIRSRLEFASPEVGNQLAVLLQHMLLASLSHSKNISIGEHDIHSCCSALSDLPLGSVGTHVILTSWMSILEWCNNGDDSNSSMDEEHVFNVCKKLGRNLIMSQYHDVVAPMLLSRTVFCGERSMSIPDTISKLKGSTAISAAQQLYERHWQKHWRMALALFAWVTSIAGPEGVIAAKTAGTLLLASGAAGTLEGCLINDEEEDDDTDSLSYLHTLFLPPPTSALMMLGTSAASSNSTTSTMTRDSWTYTDLLSDRLQVMMPLVPGFVMSLIPNLASFVKLQPKSLSLLQDLLEAIGSSFHRVLGVLLSSSDIAFGLTTRGRTGIAREHQAIIKAAKDYASPLILIIAWMEYSLRLSVKSEQMPVVLYQAPPPPKSPSDDDWVETIHHTAFSEHQEDDVIDAQFERTRNIHSLGVDELQDCQKCALSSVTDLLCQAMTYGGGEASTNLWQNIANSLLQDAATCIRRATDDNESKSTENPPNNITPSHVCRGVLCRTVAIVLTKLLRRDHEFELWSPILCESVARLMIMVEELQLLSYEGEDRTLLQGAILQVMSYGRLVTGWCQLILPSPPMPASRDFNGGSMFDAEEQDEVDSNLDRAPGASSKVLLPVLQPCLRVTMANLNNWESTTVVMEETTKMMPYLMQELRVTLVAAIVGLSFPNARDVALLGLASIRQSLNNEGEKSLDDATKKALRELSLELVEEITARYEGEKRRREKALFDAYDDDDDEEGEHDALNLLEAQSSATVERLILGNDLVPAQEEMGTETEEITFNDNDNEEVQVQNDNIVPCEAAAEKPARDNDNDGNRSGNDDFVMFHDQQQQSNDSSRPNADGNALESMLQGVQTQLGWDQYKGLGSTLEECSALIKSTSKETTDQSEMVMALLLPFLDTWDANSLLDQSELVELYNNKYCYTNKQALNDDNNNIEDGSNMELRTSPSGSAAADAMSTYIEMASVEKSRLSEFVNSFLPAHRYSCQAYTERFCWSRYMEIFSSDIQIWERGIADGNRDIRSRLMTMPCNPQFKRYIPKNLDHSNEEENGSDDVEKKATEAVPEKEANDTVEQEETVDFEKSRSDNDLTKEEQDQVEALPTMLNSSLASSRASSGVMRRASSVKLDPSALHQTLMSQRNLEIVDITKKENKDEDEAQMDPLLKDGSNEDDDDDDDDIYGDGSLGFPSREGDDEDNDDSAKKNPPTITTEDDESSLSESSITATRVSESGTGGSHQHFNIASSIYSHPPDNSSSILSLLHSSASSPALIEKHFDNCLHVKAEGSRKCTILLSTTHLILEYDSEAAGLFEGELMAVREEAERQRLIEEAGGGSSKETDDEIEDRIREELESRQKEIASLRPKSIRWNLSELSHVYLRRYRLRDSAIEMFFIPSGGSSFGGFGLYSPATSLFLDFGSGHESHRRRDEAANAIMRRSPPQTIKQWPDKSNQFLHDQLSRLTMGWVEGRITNFDYLLHLNMLAGRSYNDLCQYPVMPWVLSNYKSTEIPDLTDRKNFRDLSKPVGALNTNRLNDFLERFSTFADPTIPPFMYGSHYSTSAGVVLHFLVRMHPFAGLHRQLQSGYFDVADRLFSSIPRTWDMCTGYSAAEVKELTPEWYCNPSFLKNSNKFKLGTSQDGEVLGDVILPPWADGSPEKFVEVMRNALESRICSDMLPGWIDLIFGRKQQGPAAIEANNVFFYLTYYGSVDVAAIDDEGLRQATELQIAHFGQCPMQLFVRPHVRRASAIPTRKLTFYQMLSAYTTTAVIITAEKKPTGGNREVTSMVTSRRPWKEVEHMPFFHSPPSHKISLEAPPPGPHAHLIAVRLAGVDRCLAVDANGIFHSFRWAWKTEIEPTGTTPENKKNVSLLMDSGNFVAQRELPRFRTVPRLFHSPLVASSNRPPAVSISKTLFASRSVLLVLSDGDGKGALAMQLVDPAKGTVKGEAVVPSVHSSKINSIAMAPIGTAAGHGGVGGELAIVGSSDGNASLWRFMSSHYLPLRPRIRMRGHYGHSIYAVALNPSIHICATVSKNQCCVFSIGNGALIQSWSPPSDNILFQHLPPNQTYKTVFCDTPALDISVQGYIVTVCETTIFNDQSIPIRSVITLHLYSLEGVSLGSKALESWRGTPHKVNCTPDGTAVAVCSSRGVTVHRLSSIEPLDFMDEWQIQASDDDVSEEAAVWDIDFGPSLMRPIIAAAACSSGVLRLHALPGVSAWSERHSKKSTLSDAGSRFMGRFKTTFGSGATSKTASTAKEVSKEVKSEIKERGVGGFLSNSIFSRKSKK